MSLGSLGLLIGIALATWQLVEVVHHGSIFASLRAWAWGNRAAGRSWRRFAAELVLCPFCLSHWASAALTLLALAAGEVELGMAVLYWLGATRLANVANDFCHPWCRSPRGEGSAQPTQIPEIAEVSVSFEEEEQKDVAS